MNYQKLYDNIIYKRKNCPSEDNYTETHHILPRSLGGSDLDENLVKLSAREHYICHLLLAKIHDCDKMYYALWMMQFGKGRQKTIINSRMYEWARLNFIKYISEKNAENTGHKNSQYGSMWICNLKEKINKKINKLDEIPDGWVKGRNKWNTPTSRRVQRGTDGLSVKQRKMKKEKSRIYIINGKEYNGCKDVANDFNITHPTVLNRVKSDKYPEWKRI